MSLPHDGNAISSEALRSFECALKPGFPRLSSCSVMFGRWKLQQASVVCILLSLSTLAIFLPVIELDFTNYDDPDYVTDNQPVLSGLKWATIHWAFTHAHSANWHPLTWLSHTLDCQI